MFSSCNPKFSAVRPLPYIDFWTAHSGAGRYWSLQPVASHTCLLTVAHHCRSYPCPGSIAMIAFFHPSRFCARSESSWCCLRSLRTLSIPLSLGLPRGLFPPTFIVITCFVTFVSSLLITWPRKAFLCDICGDWFYHCVAPELFISDSVFPCFPLNPS